MKYLTRDQGGISVTWICNTTSRGLSFVVIVVSLALFAFAASSFPVPSIVSSAEAQAFWGNSYKVKKKRKKYRAKKRRSSKSRKKETKVAKEKPKGPLVINVSLKKQRLTVYEGTKVIAQSRVSSGKAGHRTPKGAFSILQKRRRHYSNLYRGASMPNMQRLTWSGIALHAGVLPGYPASHGCIRLPHGFSRSLFRMTTLGTRVVVSDGPVSPQDFAHDQMFTAFPPDAAQAAASKPIQVAANDVSSPAGNARPDPVSDVIDFGVVTAAEAAEAREEPRQSYRERRRAEGYRIEGLVRETGYELRQTELEFRSASRAAKAAEKPVKELRAKLAKAKKPVVKLKRKKAGAAKALARLNRRIAKRPKLARYKKIRNKKDKLERRVSSLSDALLAAEDRFDARQADAAPALSVADDAQARRKAALTAFRAAKKAHKAAKKSEDMFVRREKLRDKPIAIFISRRNKKLYGRQAYKPVLEAPVTFDRPDEKIGTHVFTALARKPNKTEFEWSVVTLEDRARKSSRKKSRKGKKKRKEVAVKAAPKLSPAAALERVNIPEHVREQIADVLKPGSSVIISDRGLGYETGKYTDFIVNTR